MTNIQVLRRLIAVGSAVSMGSMLVWPIAILALLATVWEGLSANWPWLLFALGYGMGIWIVVAVLPSLAIKVVLGLTLAIAPSALFLSQLGLSWSTPPIAALALSVFFGIASQAIVRYSIGPRFGEERENSYSQSTKDNLWKLGGIGVLCGIHSIWLAPASVKALTFPSPLPVIATLLSVIAAIFVIEA